MKKYFKYIAVVIITTAISCREEVQKPKVSYGASNKVSVAKTDTTQIEIADLPIQMEGTNYLIHPVGDLRVFERGSKARYGSSSVNDVSFTISNLGEYEITGYLQNLKFQQIDSDSIRPLSDKPILILTATYLKTVADKTQNKVMVYTLTDSDTNKDGKIDTSDIKTLYLSDISGENFTKVSADLEELVDWNLIESKNRLYFRTIEDTNQNGQFDKNDVLHYNYIDLASKKWEVKPYKPI
ncbi:CREC-EF hand family protein [Flavobacterium foetidum]|uniref:hypothetical protein n=1 Tax=Flavobacterium foetidum TaxID=2026681 RepID=UPI0010755D91|nr:hypothetical protein [Flavobacterium foetidum]KAF2514289.1 hypothetical protein E0W73_12860 [Flavobacterium foetidum]